MSAAIEATSSDFKEKTAKGIVLVDFWAPWCGPCRMQGPILDKVADRMGGRASILKVNVDESPDLAAEFGIRSIPSLLILKDGAVVRQFIGVQQEAALVDALESA